MIYTFYGEPVEIIGGKMLNLLDPTTLDDPTVKVRSLNDPSWVRDARLSRLRADGGDQEINDAVAAFEQGERASHGDR